MRAGSSAHRIAHSVRVWAAVTILGMVVLRAGRAAASSATPCPGQMDYKVLTFDDNYDYLSNPLCRADPAAVFHYVSIDPASGSYLSFGSQIREQYEYINQDKFGAALADDHGYMLQRYRTHADLHMGPVFRFYVELDSSLENGRPGGPRAAIDRNELTFENLFFDLKLFDRSARSLTVRLGRQQFLFGAGRLIDVRDGANVRQSFQGLSLLSTLGSTRNMTFFVRPVENETGAMEDWAAPTRYLWGDYSTRRFSRFGDANLDVYYLGFATHGARYDAGPAGVQVASDVVHTTGARVWGFVRRFDYDCEGAYQLGRFGTRMIQAWFMAANIGYTMFQMPMSPRLGLQASIYSGNRDPRGGILRTFNPLFARTSEFGEMRILAPANLMDIHPTLDVWLLENLRARGEVDVQWRQSAADGIYNLRDNLQRGALGSTASYIGAVPGARVEWSPSPHLAFTVIYQYFLTGGYLIETKPGANVNYLAVRAKFDA